VSIVDTCGKPFYLLTTGNEPDMETQMTEQPSFDSFTAFRAAQCDYYRSLHDDPGFQGAAARLALTIRFQLFEWLDGEMRRRTRPDQVLDAIAMMLATSAGELTMSIRHTCALHVDNEPPPIAMWAEMVKQVFAREFDNVMSSEPDGFVIQAVRGKPLNKS
jgi:hypothetical protein